jgi:peptidoglycan/xylan/chitin deacetylase (PgdA/CDA1 family)
VQPLAPLGTLFAGGLAARSCVAAMAAAAVLLAGCAPQALHRPDATSDAAPGSPAPTGEGVVLARDAVRAIVVAQPGETLAVLAARWRGDASRSDEIARFNGLDELRPGDVVAIPLGERNAVGIRPGAAQAVTILCYHRFGAQANTLTVTRAAFEAQMAWLAGNGYTAITFERLRAFLEGRESLPDKSVLITIDDGYRSTYDIAFPILAKHRFPATLFLYTDFVGAPDALTWGQMREMGASGLVAVQPHSKTHSNLAVRQADESEARYRERVRREIEGPIDSIRRELGARTLVYAFPYGDVNDVVAAELRARGVAMGVTVTPGGNAFFAPPRMLRRTMVFGGDDLDAFRGKVVTAIPFGKP